MQRVLYNDNNATVATRSDLHSGSQRLQLGRLCFAQVSYSWTLTAVNLIIILVIMLTCSLNVYIM